MEATETYGTWEQAAEITLPSNAATNPQAGLDGVSCTPSGNCVAVGTYFDSSGNTQAMGVTATNGTWEQAVEITLPTNAATTATNPGDRQLDGVSCTPSEDCVAVGGYLDSSGNPQPMEVTETHGTWGQAVELTSPSNAATSSNGAHFNGVSCTAPGKCVAVGGYEDSSGNGQEMVVTESHGNWGQAVELTAPLNASTTSGFAVFAGVSCTPSGDCVAVGNYIADDGHFYGMGATETHGTWGQATEMTAVSYLAGVSCTPSGECVAVGGTFGSSDNGNQQVMEVTENHGTWGQATEITLPSNATTIPQAAYQAFHGVSCTPSGNCVAVGNYLDSSGNNQAMEASTA